jgi:hypothetical protein
MPFRRFVQPAAVLTASTLLAACASADYHYSQLTGARYSQTSFDTYPVSILLVDHKSVLDGSAGVVVNGRSTANPTHFALVDPGPREITVQGPPGGAGGFGQTLTVPLDVAPCTRYYLVAVKNSPLANDFTVRVDHQEPVSGCTPA